MNVFTFKDRFEAPALAGIKVHTLRGHRKDRKPRAVVGERISLRVWTGKPYRSKQREFAQATVLHVIPVRVTHAGIRRPDLDCTLKPSLVARRDGFANWAEMKAFFQATNGLPFEGVMVVWKDLVPACETKNPGTATGDSGEGVRWRELKPTCRCGCGRLAAFMCAGTDFGGDRFENEPACVSATAYLEESATLLGLPFQKRKVQ